MSDSGSVLTDSAVSQVTESSQSGVSGSSVPLVLISAYQDQQQRHQLQTLPHLPSHRFRYTVWHELSHTHITGNQLKAPRIRDGPPEKEEMFYRIRDDTNRKLHHTRRGAERKDYRDKTENWEIAQWANLSYQELEHGYQRENFVRVLKRLLQAEDIVLLEDNLVDLHMVTFPRCTHLNLSRNYIKSFKKLPALPEVKTLVLSENVIEDLQGIQSLRKTKIEYLNLKNNPVAFTLNYRPRVFASLPQLLVLDDVPRLPSDDVFEADKNNVDEEEKDKANSCSIS